MVDRTPQQFGGVPDGETDSTAALQAALDAWQPGDQVVISGGTFRTTGALIIGLNDLVLRGDGVIRAKTPFSASVLFAIDGQGVTFDTDGLELDQADVVSNGDSIRANGAAGLQVLNVISRGTQRSFLALGDDTTDLLVAGCDHFGKGFGVLAADRPGLTRLVFRDCAFEHVGSGTPGDAIQLNCPTHGASEVSVIGCVARRYIGESSSRGMGFGFARVTDGQIIGCRAESCEGDGFHLEQASHRWLCADLRALNIGASDPVGGNGSGLIAYDCDNITVVLVSVRNCSFHGIALSGQGAAGPSQHRLNGLIERCSIDTTQRDGIHLTAQRDFRVDRNWVRDPSLNNPGLYAGIHVGQQGGTLLENMDGTGIGNTVVLSGATTPLGLIVVRPDSPDVTIDGVSGAISRLTEDGDRRLTEAGQPRILEAA
jgi:hypothetical protein